MVMGYVTVMEENLMHFTPHDLTVENAGTERIGNFQCNHFIITRKSTGVTNKIVKREVWITRDIKGINLIDVGPNYIIRKEVLVPIY
jgi:hypothetical protein